MPTSRTLLAVAATALVALATGCAQAPLPDAPAGDTSPGGPAPVSTSATPTPSPTVAAPEPQALKAAGDAWLADQRAKAPGARFIGTSDVIASGNGVFGVRLSAERVLATDAVITSHTLYGDGSAVWTGADLVSDRALAARAIVDAALTRRARPAATLADPAVRDTLFQDVSFDTNGDLLVVAPTGLLAPYQGTRFTVRVPAAAIEALLTGPGRRVREASGVTLTRPAQDRPVDCADARCVALTWDDGPGPDTARLLDSLQAAGARGTFFWLGPQAAKHSDEVRRAASLGVVGNHGWSHAQLNKLSRDGQARDVQRGAAAFAAAGAPAPTLLRPPYGAFNGTTRTLGVPLVIWDVDTLDWFTKDRQAVVDAVLTQVTPGSIVLMHDIHAPTVDAAPAILEGLARRGYTTVTVPELMGAEPAAGAVITRR